MRHLTAKTLIALACAIILTHAIVPHHHDDCDGEEGHCKLAEMLSHLVISTKDDEVAFSISVKADVHELFDLVAALPTQGGLPAEAALCGSMPVAQATAIPRPPDIGGRSLRGPPCRTA